MLNPLITVVGSVRPVHLYVSRPSYISTRPLHMYHADRRLTRIALFHKRLTGPQKNVNTPPGSFIRLATPFFLSFPSYPAYPLGPINCVISPKLFRPPSEGKTSVLLKPRGGVKSAPAINRFRMLRFEPGVALVRGGLRPP
jgi:hypothetical protein